MRLGWIGAAAALVIGLSASVGRAAIKTEIVKYEAGAVDAVGFVAYDDSINAKRPGVLIVHEWWGLNDYSKNRAKQLAALGYVAFAADVYGQGQTTDDPAV